MTEKQTAVTVREGGVALISVREVKAQTEAIHRLFKEVLVKDTHYGIIPGTPKPSLYKPGAEKIGLLLHLAPTFKRQIEKEGQHWTVISECTLKHQTTGIEIASGGGMCTTRETKYAYRQATRKCPKCGKPAIIKGKTEYGGGWVCFDKKGGCKAKWPDGAKEIEAQSEEREENPNLADTYNTVMKMADKRAFVAATLFGTAASDIFTQDVEDFGEYEDKGAPIPAKSARDIQAGAKSLPSDEFEAHIRDMESAFERGEGPGWWIGNKAIREQCSDEQLTRLIACKNELKKSAGGGAPAGLVPPPGAADTPPVPPPVERDEEYPARAHLPTFPAMPESVMKVLDNDKLKILRGIDSDVRSAWMGLAQDEAAVVAAFKEHQARWGKELTTQGSPAEANAFSTYKKVLLHVLHEAGLP